VGLAADLAPSGTTIGQVEVATFNADWTRVRLAIAPTEPHDASLPAAPAGLWTVSLVRTGGAAPIRPVACRVQRDNDPFGYARGGRQSYLDDPADDGFTADGAPARVDATAEAFVRRFGTVNGLATHSRVTVVSSFYDDTGRANEYASAGPAPGTAGPGAVHVSLAADASTALRGSLAAGTRSGSARRLAGTSMAAPLQARRAALGWMLPPGSPAQPRPAEFTASLQESDERPTRLGQALAGWT
jgi:hypothetical protein